MDKSCNICKFAEYCFDGCCGETWWCTNLNNSLGVLGVGKKIDVNFRFSIYDIWFLLFKLGIR